MAKHVTFKVCKRLHETTKKPVGWDVYKIINTSNYSVPVTQLRTAPDAQDYAWQQAKEYADRGWSVTVTIDARG